MKIMTRLLTATALTVAAGIAHAGEKWDMPIIF